MQPGSTLTNEINDEAFEGVVSIAEARFEHWRRTVGLFAGPIAFLLVWLLPLGGLSSEAHRLAAVVTLVVCWWVTEPIPLPATALVGVTLAALAGIAPAAEAFAPFANPIIFLFIGSFMIGKAMSPSARAWRSCCPSRRRRTRSSTAPVSSRSRR
ncbi:MAG: anion permease [Acidobacteria bacterium]|nr:anion permease [Acidobacteriota bacterium]